MSIRDGTEFTAEGRKHTLNEKSDALNSNTNVKKWDLNDNFLYAPKKSESDYWNILLQPLLEEDKKQCDSWTDEVQNLLIFAGLFSAVVTAFIVESYKSLQPDPEEVMVGLLFRIASRLESPNATSMLPELMNPLTSQFLPTPSSIRVNILWFISLVLSLTTVLIGITSLQWLREHQSYPNLPKREIYSLLHMRTQSLKHWHVPRIISSLPLLLQLALVLFLIGLIDFIRPFGIKTLIPICVMIGITLTFILYTTVSSTSQGILLYFQFRFKWVPQSKDVPAPCPYKSPQSSLILYIYSSSLKACRPFYRALSGKKLELDQIFNWLIFAYIPSRDSLTWAQFDRAWLSIRDLFAQRSKGYRASTQEHQLLGMLYPPIYDTITGLRNSMDDIEQFVEESLLISGYHCIAEISQERLLLEDDALVNSQDFYLQNNYFQELVIPEWQKKDDNTFILDYFDLQPGEDAQTPQMLHHENLHLFIEKHCESFRESTLNWHKWELKYRLLNYLYSNLDGKLLPKSTPKASLEIPDCMSIEEFLNYSDHPNEFFVKHAELLLTLFHTIHTSNHLSNLENGHQVKNRLLYRNIFSLVSQAGFIIDLLSKEASNSVSNSYTLEKFNSIPKLISNALVAELSHSETINLPSPLFYCAALYASELISHHVEVDSDLCSLLSTLHRYEEQSIKKGIRDIKLESMYEGVQSGEHSVFDDDWWKFLSSY